MAEGLMMDPVGLGIYSGVLQSCRFKSHFEKTARQQEWIPRCLGVLRLSCFLHTEGLLIAVV